MSGGSKSRSGAGVREVSEEDAMDVRTALTEAMARLGAAHVPSHTLAAELLLMHALGRDRAWIYAHPEGPLDSAAMANYFALVARRAAGEPVQYLTGKQEFWGLEFEVTPAVLIPRPETEHVVEVALERLSARGASGQPVRIADVGTGSGCIAVALGRELPHAEIVATDISAAALDVARRNAARHGVSDRIHFLETDLLEAASLLPLATRHSPLPFDLIASNPPYIARDEAASLPREVREHEPEAALFGGAAGLEIYARLIEQAASLLRTGGVLVVELGYGSDERVREMFHVKHCWHKVSIINDLAGIPRVLSAVLA
jgi:release factor glutamine methyltransferase